MLSKAVTKVVTKAVTKLIVLSASSLIALSASAGIVKVESKNDLNMTAKRFVAALANAEVPVRSEKSISKKLPGGFSRTGKEIVFSNPFFGWSLGECHRGLRKDEPMTARIWKGTNGQVWLEYDAPEAVINSFGVIECGNEADKVQGALDAFVDAAVE